MQHGQRNDNVVKTIERESAMISISILQTGFSGYFGSSTLGTFGGSSTQSSFWPNTMVFPGTFLRRFKYMHFFLSCMLSYLILLYRRIPLQFIFRLKSVEFSMYESTSSRAININIRTGLNMRNANSDRVQWFVFFFFVFHLNCLFWFLIFIRCLGLILMNAYEQRRIKVCW